MQRQMQWSKFIEVEALEKSSQPSSVELEIEAFHMSEKKKETMKKQSLVTKQIITVQKASRENNITLILPMPFEVPIWHDHAML